ncbi:hypothetical protein D7D52_25325 [Nocardia yunnanensis]|uniref:Uncharacterized protein n=1 Tax=Nocardia yunnanensis TaxID=2382165 RepID=A0A386ZHJ6_9NOCA|nr:hypothetical protein [Nocardia yunnanensis]AYF76584.1 hypothetical protein D7D52_25325 [Nocardia yunnanensis]
MDIEDIVSQDNSTAESPDVGFRMGASATTAAPGNAPGRLAEQVVGELLTLIPAGWDRLDAAIAMTVSDEAAQVVASDGQRAVPVSLTARVVELLRKLRHQGAESAEGPWWRFLATVTRSGGAEIEYDYGVEPFPDHQLFPAAAYVADLQVYPRRKLPIWLAAYIGHEDRQIRTPRQAFADAQAGGTTGAIEVPAEEGLPPFPVLWARWAVISAAFVAAKSPRGPRITSALGWFEGSTRSGSTVHRLPHGRAVLSGGVWNAPSLDAVYNGGAPMPQFFRGAPEWVADPVLSPRTSNGLLSFCYWWDGNTWYRGESPPVSGLRDALPGVWSSDSVFDVLTQIVDDKASSWLTALIAAAETGRVTRALLSRTLSGDNFDVDSSYYQLILAGIAE